VLFHLNRKITMKERNGTESNKEGFFRLLGPSAADLGYHMKNSLFKSIY
jgi:hypothetical protein